MGIMKGVHKRENFYGRAEIFSKLSGIDLKKILETSKDVLNFKNYVPEKAWHNTELCIAFTENYFKVRYFNNSTENKLYIESVEFLLKELAKSRATDFNYFLDELKIGNLTKTVRTNNFSSFNFVKNFKEDFVVFPFQLGSLHKNENPHQTTLNYGRNEFGVSTLMGISMLMIEPEICSSFAEGFVCVGDSMKTKNNEIGVPALFFENNLDSGGKVVLESILFTEKNKIFPATGFFDLK